MRKKISYEKFEPMFAQIISIPGQGSALEQMDKLIRRTQRIALYEILDQANPKELDQFPIITDNSIAQCGKKLPARLRYRLPTWRGYDDVFWQALGDYIILALHRVKDVEYDSQRAKICIQYFNKATGKIIKSAEDIRIIIRGLAYLIDTEFLPTDFTRFRRMTERKDSLGEVSKEKAALAGLILKFI